MSTERIQIQLYLHRTFVSPNLSVSPELLGRSHDFQFRGRRVLITLPQLSDTDQCDDSDPKATCNSWLLVDGLKVPAQYNVHNIDVKVFSDELTKIHPEMLKLHINQIALLEESEQTVLNAKCADDSSIAMEAYDHWLAVMRWTTKAFRIGRSAVVSNASGRNSTLCALDTNKRVWGGPICLSVEFPHRVTNEEWETASLKLADDKAIPAHIALLQDAHEYNFRRDYRRSMIDIAIACEVFLRTKVLSALPPGIPGPVLNSIESNNISQYVNHYFPPLLTNVGQTKFTPIKKELTSLFDARNKIMHMDNKERATSDECSRFLCTAEKLFAIEENFCSPPAPKISALLAEDCEKEIG